MGTKSAKRKRVPAVAAPPAVVLASNCTVKDAAALKDSLCGRLDDEDVVTLDIRTVERVDTATMQVLCAFVRDRAANGRAVEWLGDSAIVREAAHLLGITNLLAPPAEATR